MSDDKNKNASKIKRRDFLKVAAVGTGTMAASPSAVAGWRDEAVDYTQRTYLANPLSDMQALYDVVVIGSGYGGSVTAARLSESASVCVLERGKEYHPGDFPENIFEAAANLKSPVHPLGLYELEFYGDASVVAGSGFGGTSLINHGIATKPEAEIFDMAYWPQAIRDDRDSGLLYHYYDRAAEMLLPEKFPNSVSLADKAKVLKKTSTLVGENFEVADIYVNYTQYDGEYNHVGVYQNACTMCGNCLTGCNVGAKNTLNMNYLPAAKLNGAHLFSQIQVEYFEKLETGNYRIYFRVGKMTAFDKSMVDQHTLHYVDAKNLVLSAGTMGSNKIMQRSQEEFGLPLSDALGQGFSGNGDTIGFGYNGDDKTNIEGYGNVKRYFWEPIVGPGSVGITQHNTSEDLLKRFVIEDASIPSAAVGILQSSINLLGGFPDNLEDFLRILGDVILHSPHGALNHSQLYLGVGHDGAEGAIVRKGNRFKIEWPNVKDNPYLKAIEQAMRDHTAAQGANYIRNPLGYITTHPLGGCRMGEDATQGVVNHKCQAFNPDAGDDAVHKGLYVIDGSVVPNSLGTNPSFTIAALAERAADFMLSDIIDGK